MEILVVLLVAWLVITLVGHLSWLAIKHLFLALTGTSTPSPSPVDSKQSDILATHRVVSRLAGKGLIDPEDAERLRENLRSLQSPDAPVRATLVGPETRLEASPNVPGDPASLPVGVRLPRPEADSVRDADPPDAPVRPTADWSAPIADQSTPSVSPTETPLSHPTIPQASSPSEPQQSIAGQAAAAQAATVREEPSFSKAEIIRSFLAARNIRWGELVAGLLIVVCSIGLVVSLWNTLLDAHRVIPSLIFLTANAAIFAAGLYTLSRWRLRHTSRAVLVIATLLVPLSVLAGIAAAGNDVDAVQLTDPITLVSLLAGGVVYLLLLLSGSRALVGRAHAAPLTLAVAGSAILLPMIPAAIRAFGNDAVWIVSGGAIAFMAAAIWMIRRTSSRRSKLGVTSARSRLLLIGLGGFAVSVLVGYSIFAIWPVENVTMALPIALAIIPAFVGLTGAGRSLMLSASHPTQAMIGALTCVLAIGATATMLPASMIGMQWVWAWAVVLSVTGVIAGWLLNQPRWLPMATVPMGIATLFSSPVWLSGLTWETTELWRRIVGGEPMMAAALIAAITLGVSYLLRDAASRKWMQWAAVGWVSLALVIATALTFGPLSLLSTVPWWTVTIVLTVAAIVSAAIAMRQRNVAYVAIATVALAWFSVLRPITIAWPIAVEPSSIWMLVCLFVAATLMILTEISNRFDGKEPTGATQQWAIGGSVAASLAVVAACFWVENNWSQAAIGLAASTALLIWASTHLRDEIVLRSAQAASVILAISLGYGMAYDWMFPLQAWSTGSAVWTWAIVAISVTAFWFAIRELGVVAQKSAFDRLGWLQDSSVAPSKMVDGLTLAFATVCLAGAAVWAFGGLILDTVPVAHWTSYSGITLPLFALVAGLAVSAWALRHVQSVGREIARWLLSVVTVSLVIWTATQLSGRLLDGVTEQLVLATTLGALGCVALATWGIPRWATSRQSMQADLPNVAGLGLVACSSATLLLFDWLDPLIHGLKPDRLATWSVATWWFAGAVGLLWTGQRRKSASLAGLSSILLPATTALLVPVSMESHPVVWLQISALASLLWAAATFWWLRHDQATATPAIQGGLRFVSIVGTTSAAVAIVCILLNIVPLQVVLGPAGALVSLVAVALLCAGPKRFGFGVLPWPLGVTLLSAQITWLMIVLGWISASQAMNVMASVWLVGSIASMIRFQWDESSFDFWHSVVGCVATTSVAIALIVSGSSFAIWLGMAACVAGAVFVASVGNRAQLAVHRIAVIRALGWFVTLGGCFLIFDHLQAAESVVVWTAVLLWGTALVIGWRVLAPDRPLHQSIAWRAVPDIELVALLVLGLTGEITAVILVSDDLDFEPLVSDPMGWLRVACWMAVAATAWLHVERKAVWHWAIGGLVGAVGLVTTRIAMDYGAGWVERVMLVSLAGGFVVAVLAQWLPALSRINHKLLSLRLEQPLPESFPPYDAHRLMRALCHLSFAVGGFVCVVSVLMIAHLETASTIYLTIGGLVLATWAMTEMAEISNNESIRHGAVHSGLIALALFASVTADPSSHPFLSATMRWLLVSVIAAGSITLLLPKILGDTITQRWHGALRRGAMTAGVSVVVSLVVMLITEAIFRIDGQSGAVSRPMVGAVAIVLAASSLICGVMAVFSGPGFKYRDAWKLTDHQRRGLIVLTQMMGFVTWLHLFLCESPWSLVGLRAYWPFTVMALAFVSVGATEWGRRRNDELLSTTLKQTALYLPLIPVVGFWLSGIATGWGPGSDLSWSYIGGKVTYEVVLTIGAIYYVLLSAIWRGALPRVAAVVLGNAALWTVLYQTASWGFLSHPQVWLIPPAVCVLAVTHLYRKQLDPMIASGIRYATTLVIYISSTADMLMQNIGTTISGPIVLVVLALMGMGLGVVLRVRPFLYLGAIFVFVGVTSMVAHAHQQIDAVWPWWVFGITTGIGLLAVLTAIEKNKPKLRQYADTLSAWDG
ncbi:MAG: hypothetical protein HKN47_23795 [Pirellulaceae bacterium]|nr:hypothetical protein [Pirellulaceae bacterium]